MRERATFTPTHGLPIAGELTFDGSVAFLVEGEPQSLADLPAGTLTVHAVRFTIGAEALVRHAVAAGLNATLECEQPRESKRDRRSRRW